MSKYNFKIPKDSIPILEEFVKTNFPKSYQSNLCRYFSVLEYVFLGSNNHRTVVPINRDFLVETLKISRKNASFIIKSLCDLNLLKKESDGKFGVRSATYSLLDKSDLALSIPFEVFEHKATKNIIERRNMNRTDNTRFENTEVANKLLHYLLSIQIDNTLLSTIISNPLFPFSYLSPYRVQHKSVIKEIKEFKTKFKNIVSISQGDIFIKRNNGKGRVYTNFSVMDREHRRYLSYEGQTLKCLDISNSQPLIFCAFIKKYCEDNKINIPFDEYNHYKDLVEKGMFYERFMEGDEFKQENRKDFKQAFFGSVFYTKVSNIPYELRKRFTKVFPEIYSIMDTIKKKHGNDGFALLMQELEANIIWDKVNAPMLLEGHLCYNIYDSIISHDMQTINEAKKRIQKEFSVLGITPNFKLEIFE